MFTLTSVVRLHGDVSNEHEGSDIIYSEHCLRLTPFPPDFHVCQMKLRFCGLSLAHCLLSYRIVSYRITSHYITSYHISYHIISYHIISYHIMYGTRIYLATTVPVNVLAPVNARPSAVSRHSDECKLRSVLPPFSSHCNVIYSLANEMASFKMADKNIP